jgi:hypothetical protein
MGRTISWTPSLAGICCPLCCCSWRRGGGAAAAVLPLVSLSRLVRVFDRARRAAATAVLLPVSLSEALAAYRGGPIGSRIGFSVASPRRDIVADRRTSGNPHPQFGWICPTDRGGDRKDSAESSGSSESAGMVRPRAGSGLAQRGRDRACDLSVLANDRRAPRVALAAKCVPPFGVGPAPRCRGRS